MIQFFQSLSPKIQTRLALYLGAAVITFFLMTLAGFFSIREEAKEDDRLDEAARLARTVDTDFQLAVSKGKNFAILKDETNKARTLAYFKEAQDNFSQLSQTERDPQGRQLLGRLGAGLQSLGVSLDELVSKAKKSDSAEKLYYRYLKDITIDFDKASLDYLDFLGRKIQSEESELNEKVFLDLLLALAGAFLGLGGMVLSFSNARNLNRALQSEKASQERFERFAEVSKEGILIHEKGIILDVNPALLEMTGLEASDLIGKDTTCFMGAETVEKIHRMRREGYPQEPYEITVIRKDGTEFPAEAHGRYFDLGGKRLRVVSVWNVTERKRTEEALRKSEVRFQAMLENSYEGITLAGPDGKVLYISPANKKITGYEPNERMGRSVLDVVHPEDRPRAIQTLAQLRENPGLVMTGQFRIQNKSGEWRHAEITAINLLDNPDVGGILLNSRDITEKVKVEGALRQQERYFRALIEKSYDAILLIRKDGKIAYGSPGMSNMYGYTPEERVGRDSMELIHPEDQGLARETLAQLFQKPDASEILHVRLKHKEGHYLTVEIRATNLLEDPDVGGVVVNFRDVTGKVMAEETLRESEEKFRSLIENSHDVLSITGRDGRMTYISPSVKRVLGYEPSERIGRGYLEIMHPEDAERIRGEFVKLLGMSGSTWTVQFRLRHKDGSWRTVESTGTNLLENPTVRGMVYNLRDITAKVEAEAALRKSEEHFRTLIEKSNDVISLIQADGMTRYVTPSVKRVMGYEPEEREGRSYNELVHPEDLPEIQGFFQYLLRNPGVTLTTRARLRHKDGRWRHVEGSATNLIDNPDIGAIISNYRDVTERFEAEAAVRRSEENFRNLIEKAPDAVFITRENNLVYVNSKTLALLGYDEKEELLGRSGPDLVHPEDRRGVTSRIQILNEGGRTYPSEIRMIKRDGAVIGVEASSILIQFEGAPAIMVSLRDITARKQAEAAAQENQQRYQSLVESMPDAVMIHDEENILYVNPSAVRMFGSQSESDLLSKPFWVVVPYEFREKVRARIKAVIEKGASNELAERKLRRLDEKLIDVLVTSVPFYDRGRRVVLAIFLDITPLKEAERKAQRYQQLAALGEMAAGMAHEIRNPAAAISAQAQYLLKKLEGNGTTYEQLKDIIHQCERLDTLVHDTLDYSPEKKFEERAEIPAKELLQKALWLAQTQFGPSHARVKAELDLPREPLLLHIHPTRMERVLVNLILNAFQAMPEGGTVRLKAENRENRVVLRVEDDGKGIRAEDLPRLFEPFYTSRKMGSGLGLAICQKIVEEHKGQIRVERVEPHGAAFTIELPLEKEAVS